MTTPKQIFLVGTSHAYQFGDGVVFGETTCTPEAAAQFRQCLTNIYNINRIRAFAEEMSVDALAEQKLTASLPKLVADEFLVCHRYCDPTRLEKVQWGIRQDNDIRLEHMNDGWTQEQIEADVLARGSAPSDRIRERFWLQSILELDMWPLLFICGTNHFTSFAALLKVNGLDIVETHRDWKPNANQGHH